MSSDGDLRPMLRRRLREVHWTTVETGLVEQGVPDLEGCAGGVQFWVECKRTLAWAVRVRPEQAGWHLTRARHGGRSFFAVRRMALSGPRRGGGADELWLVRGAHARELRVSGLRGLPRGALALPAQCGGPARWDWDAVLAALLGS